MAVRARPDNLSLVDAAVPASAGASAVDFDELWEHRESLRAICLRMADDPTTADDVVQETFVRALQHAGTLDRRASFAPWLATVARRRSIDEMRSRRRLRLMDTTPEVQGAGTDDPAEQVLKQEMVRRLRVALGELSNRERQLLLRQVTHGLSLAELADEEATSVASVRSVLSRARTKLRGSLERGGPLAAAPLARLMAGLKRRLQQAAGRFEGHVPLVAGAGTQFGDVVAAAVAALALLVGGQAIDSEATLMPRVVTIATDGTIAVSGKDPGRTGADAPAKQDVQQGPNPAGDEPATTGGGTAPDRPLTAVPPGVDLPPLSDGVDQPDDAFSDSLAVSQEGSTVISVGSTTAAAGNGNASGDPAMFRSDDGGRTWHRLPAGGFQFGRVVLPPTFPRQPTFFVDDGMTLRRTDDGGRNFGLAVATTRNAAAVSPRYRDGDRRLIVGSVGLAAYDADAGTVTPFVGTPLSTTALGSLVFPPRFWLDESVLVGTGVHVQGQLRGFVQRCTPAQCAPALELPGARQAPKLLASSAGSGLVLAWTRDRLYRSVDGGESFAAVALPPGGGVRSIVEGKPGQLLLARWNRGNAFGSGLWRSQDGGLTWAPMAVDSVLQQGALSVAFLGTDRILAGPSKGPGMVCSADDGVTWASRCS